MTNNIELSEDIIQTVFLKYFEKMNSIADKSKTGYWLFTTARNQVFDYYRKNKAKLESQADFETGDFNLQSEYNLQSELEMKELKSLILFELSKFPFEQKETFLLKEYGGLTYKEIAEITKSDVNSVKSRLYKARQKLIKKIGKIMGVKNAPE